MKKLVSSLVTSGIVITVIMISFVIYHLDKPSSETEKTPQPSTVDCLHTGTTHNVIIQNAIADPAHTAAHLCDSLTITNSDDRVRLIAFGTHEQHQSYYGITEKVLSQQQSFTILLNKAGTYSFHDHIGDVAHGDFTVN